MPTATDILHSLARQRGTGASNPLIFLRTLESRHGALISNLTLNDHLAQSWVRLTGAPFCQHQSLSLALLRRGEPFALVGGGVAARQTLYLLLHEMLASEAFARAMLLVPDEATAAIYCAEIDALNAAMGSPLSVLSPGVGTIARDAPAAHVLLVTPESLHHHVLRFHDRAWEQFWSHLSLLLLIDMDHYHGIGSAHLAALLMRCARLVPRPPLLAATLANVRDSETTLMNLFGQPWRLIPVDDTPRRALAQAIWRADDDRLSDVVKMASHYEREGYQVHITCDCMELPLLLALIGTHAQGITIGTVPQRSQIQLFVGYQESNTLLHQSFAGSFSETPHLVVLLLGNTPIERTLVRLNQETEHKEGRVSLFSAPLPAWLPPPTNAYISAQHLLCAASEHPLLAAEVDDWQAGDMVTRLEQRNLLVRLPGESDRWQPLLAADDPYKDVGFLSASGPPILVYNERGILIDMLDPSLFDRWCFTGAAMPPGRGGYRVVDRNEEKATLSLRPEREQRRTFPLRRCEMTMREERERRSLRERTIGWGRIVIDEEIYGYREVKPHTSPVDQAVAPSLANRWTAPAVWIDLPMRMKATGQLVGWSLAAALPLLVLCRNTDLVPAYDPGIGRLYLIDAQPGGNGLAAWVYHHLEELLPLAYDIALDCRSDPLLEPLARTDMDWLLSLLGGDVAIPPARRSSRPAFDEDSHLYLEEGRRSKPVASAVPSAPAAPSVPRAAPAPPPASTVPPHKDADPKPAPSPLPPPEQPRSAEDQRQEKPAPPEQKVSRGRRARGQPAAGAQREAPERTGQEKPTPTSEPPVRKPPVPTSEANTLPPDASAILAKLQHLQKQQRNNPASGTNSTPSPQTQQTGATFPVAPQFQAGDRVYCRPYGQGIVRASRVEQGQEIIRIEFPDYGELDINPSVSAVRRVEDEAHTT